MPLSVKIFMLAACDFAGSCWHWLTLLALSAMSRRWELLHAAASVRPSWAASVALVTFEAIGEVGDLDAVSKQAAGIRNVLDTLDADSKVND